MLFQCDPIFVCKERGLQYRVAPKRRSTLVGSDHTHKGKAKACTTLHGLNLNIRLGMEIIGCDKHTSVLRGGINNTSLL
jgi:hypothetical protein